MVARGASDRLGADGRDRGQLVLLGAITLSLLIVGLVVVFNSALFTETVDRESAVGPGRDAAEFADETSRNVRSLTIRVNHAREYTSQSDLEAAMVANVSNYSAVLREAYLDSGATYADVTFDPGASSYGRRAVQDEDATFENPSGGGGSDWDPINPATPTEVGWLTVNLNASELSLTETFDVILINASGDRMNVSFRRNATGYVVITSNFTATPAANTTVTCAPVSGRLLVDVLGGAVFARDCAFNASERLPGPYRVEFRDGDAATGKYEIVIKSDSSAINDDISSCPDDPVCHAPAVWTANVTVSYRSPQVGYEHTRDMEVYNRTHA